MLEVLIVEDDQISLSVFVDFLAEFEHLVIETETDGEMALE
jgi:hypothetical protein